MHIVQRKTGHRSTSVRIYKIINNVQQKKVSKIIPGEKDENVKLFLEDDVRKPKRTCNFTLSASEIKVESGIVSIKLIWTTNILFYTLSYL